MSWFKAGEVPFLSGAEGVPVELKINKPITRIMLVLDGTQTSGSGGTLVEDSSMNLMRQVRLVKGGENIQVLGNNSDLWAGGRALDVVNRTWLRNVPHFGPAATSGTNTLRHTVMMPVSVPQELYGRNLVNATALRIPGDNWQVFVSWGTLASLVTGGSGYAIGAGTIAEVYVETMEGLDAGYPAASFFLRTVPSIQDIGTAAATSEAQFRLNRNGEVLFHALQAIDAGARSDSFITQLQYILNQDTTRARLSWFAAQGLAEANGDAPGNLPLGYGAIDFDAGHNFVNAVPAANAEGWDVLIDHAASTAVARLQQQVYYLTSRGGK